MDHTLFGDLSIPITLEDLDALGAMGGNELAQASQVLGHFSSSQEFVLRKIPSCDGSSSNRIPRSLLTSVQLFSEWHKHLESILGVLSSEITCFKSLLENRPVSSKFFLEDLKSLEEDESSIFRDFQAVFEKGKLSVKENFFLSESILSSLTLLFKKMERSFVTLRDRLRICEQKYLGKGFSLRHFFYHDFQSRFHYRHCIPDDSYHRELELIGGLIFSEFHDRERRTFLRPEPLLDVPLPIVSDYFFIHVRDFSALYEYSVERYKIISERAAYFRKFLVGKTALSSSFFQDIENIQESLFKVFSDIQTIFERGRCSLENDPFLNHSVLPKFTLLLRKVLGYLSRLEFRLNCVERQFDFSRDDVNYVNRRISYIPPSSIDLPLAEVSLDGLFLKDFLDLRNNTE